MGFQFIVFFILHNWTVKVIIESIGGRNLLAQSGNIGKALLLGRIALALMIPASMARRRICLQGI